MVGSINDQCLWYQTQSHNDKSNSCSKTTRDNGAIENTALTKRATISKTICASWYLDLDCAVIFRSLPTGLSTLLNCADTQNIINELYDPNRQYQASHSRTSFQHKYFTKSEAWLESEQPLSRFLIKVSRTSLPKSPVGMIPGGIPLATASCSKIRLRPSLHLMGRQITGMKLLNENILS